MITFHKLTQNQFDKVVQKGNLIKDALYFITDTRVIKLCNGEGSVTTFGTIFKVVDEFPDSNILQFCIYENKTTKEQRIWDESSNKWQILSYPVIDQITNDLVASDAIDTLPTTKAVYNKIAEAELGVQVKLHTPVQTLIALENLPLSDIEDRCLILVQNVGLYRYDKDSEDFDDPNTDSVVTPKEIQESGGSGRWIKMFNNMGYVKGDGIDITLNPNDTNQLISLNVNTDQFTFIDGKLNLNSGSETLNTKVDKIEEGHEEEIAVWENDGNLKTTGFKIGTDQDDLTSQNITDIPAKTIVTERAIKWYVDRSLSFNSNDIDNHISY